MRFKKLTREDKQYIKEVYKLNPDREAGQQELADYFEVHVRTIRRWAKKMDLGVMAKNITDPAKVLIYDIETPRLRANVWWSGKQFVNGNDIVDEPNIITVAWKWFGSDKIHSLEWDKHQSDSNLVEEFLEEYNKADMVVGINNDNFDNRWINARAAKYGLYVNRFVKSLDLQKQAKSLFRLPSYALKYLCKFFNVQMKLQHEGIIMWDMIQHGTNKQKKEYMKKMIDYNIGDIVSTEEVYLKMIPYLNHKIHLGMVKGNNKLSCPHCGGENIELVKTTYTAAGTVQRIMKCNDDRAQFKISNSNYLKFIER